MRLTHLALGLALSAFAAGAQAAVLSSNSFEFADGNNDGFVSFREFATTEPAGASRAFIFADKEKDGRLDRAEFHEAKRIAKRSRSFDGGGN